VLGAQLASALGYLHSEGVLHLDLKASNVIAEGGRAKLIDLSHARRAGHMRPGGGTWSSMAPEQARGGLVESPADAWGLGLVLYEAWSGIAPLLDIADELDVDEPQLHARVPPVRTARRGLPRVLAEVIDACLEPEPSDRPAVAEIGRACGDAA
jgi:serine/threonine protein kinase